VSTVETVIDESISGIQELYSNMTFAQQVHKSDNTDSDQK